MRFRELLRRIRVRGPSGDRVELKPAEQTAMSYLLRVERANFETIRAVVEAMEFALAPDIGEVVAALTSQGLAEARLQPDDPSGTVYVPTAKGRRLKGRIPENPRTTTDFWL